jgi:hypothetical protein
VGGRPLKPSWRFLELTVGPAYIGHYEGAHSFGALAAGRIGHTPGHYLAAGLAFNAVVTAVEGKLIFTAGFGFSLRTWQPIEVNTPWT